MSRHLTSSVITFTLTVSVSCRRAPYVEIGFAGTRDYDDRVGEESPSSMARSLLVDGVGVRL